MEQIITCPPGPLPVGDEEEEEESSSNDDDDLKSCPAEKRATKKKNMIFSGPHVQCDYTKQLVYHERVDMKKSSRHRHKSDESKSKNQFSDMKRGHKSMPVFERKISEKSLSTIDSDGDTPPKPCFGVGFEGDDFTGLEDESPAITT